MMQASDFGNLHDSARVRELDRPDIRRTLVDCPVRASTDRETPRRVRGFCPKRLVQMPLESVDPSVSICRSAPVTTVQERDASGSPPMHSVPSAALACAIALSKSSETSAGIPRVYELTGADNGTARNVPRLMSADILNACWLDGESKVEECAARRSSFVYIRISGGPDAKAECEGPHLDELGIGAPFVCLDPSLVGERRERSSGIGVRRSAERHHENGRAHAVPDGPGGHAPHRFGSHRSGLLP